MLDRDRYVQIEHKVSEKFKSARGVPQGFILGPILILVIINYLPSFMGDDFIIHFADDTNILFKANSCQTLISRLESSLRKIDQ